MLENVGQSVVYTFMAVSTNEPVKQPRKSKLALQWYCITLYGLNLN